MDVTHYLYHSAYQFKGPYQLVYLANSHHLLLVYFSSCLSAHIGAMLLGHLITCDHGYLEGYTCRTYLSVTSIPAHAPVNYLPNEAGCPPVC